MQIGNFKHRVDLFIKVTWFCHKIALCDQRIQDNKTDINIILKLLIFLHFILSVVHFWQGLPTKPEGAVVECVWWICWFFLTENQCACHLMLNFNLKYLLRIHDVFVTPVSHWMMRRKRENLCRCACFLEFLLDVQGKKETKPETDIHHLFASYCWNEVCSYYHNNVLFQVALKCL